MSTFPQDALSLVVKFKAAAKGSPFKNALVLNGDNIGTIVDMIKRRKFGATKRVDEKGNGGPIMLVIMHNTVDCVQKGGTVKEFSISSGY